MREPGEGELFADTQDLCTVNFVTQKRVAGCIGWSAVSGG